MPYADSGGVRLYFEETGAGLPVLFIHELAGTHRSWEPQVRYLSRRYRCITYAARGYPPSDVPDVVDAYSQDHATDDAVAILDAAGVDKAHVVGLSMGGFAALHLGLRYPERVLSLTVAGCGYGAEPERLDQARADARALADRLDREGMAAFADFYANGPYRQPFRRHDPRGWEEMRDQLARNSATGTSLTLRGVLGRRPSLWELEKNLRALSVPVLVVTGDDDEPCLVPDLYLKRTIPDAALWVMARAGHAINLEEPGLFSEGLLRFFSTVEHGRWWS